MPSKPSTLIKRGMKRFPDVKPCRGEMFMVNKKGEVSKACALGFLILGSNGKRIRKKVEEEFGIYTEDYAYNLIDRGKVEDKLEADIEVINDNNGLKAVLRALEKVGL